MVSRRHIDDVNSFLQATVSVGYRGRSNLKGLIEQLYKNSAARPILLHLGEHMSCNNLVTPSQWSNYQVLLENNETLETTDLPKAKRRMEIRKKDFLEKSISLKKKLDTAKQYKERLEKQVSCLQKVQAYSNEQENILNDNKKTSNATLKTHKFNKKEQLSKYFSDVSVINNQTSLIHCNYENEVNRQSSFMHIPLDSYMFSEVDYTNHLTEYAKRQYLKVQDSAASLQMSYVSLHDMTVMLQDETCYPRKEILQDLQREAFAYASKKKRVIISKANMEKASAVYNMLQKETKKFKCDHNSHLSTMKNNAKGIKLKIEQLQKEVLPRLISKGTRFQKNLILARVFQEKRLKQRKITCMQKQLIQLLLQQTCRLSCLWMILQFEKSQMSVLSKTMQTFGTILKNDLEAVKHSIQNLQSVEANAVNHSKDPKAVIDKRDNVMLALHNALVLDTEEYSMFHTFPTACKAAVDLQQKLSSLDVEHDRDASKTSVQQLVYSLLQFYWKHSNVIKNEEKVLLSSKELSTAIKGVSEDVKSMKSNVPLLLAKVDKKRGYLEHNSNAVVTKKLWLDFVLDCIT